MTEKLQLYHCQVCTNLTEVIVSGVGELVCCGKPMVLMEPQKMDEEMLHEKHVPVFTKIDDGSVEIRVGSIPHPMENEHYIQFIEAISQDKKSVHQRYLNPGETPSMNLKNAEGKMSAREFCNIHGLWEGESD